MSSVDETVEQIVAAHAAGGTRFDAAGVESFALAQGEGEPVVLLHGLPTSSYLYRKVIPELAERGFRALSFDLPGLGLAARPPGFDYTFDGLGRWATALALRAALEECRNGPHAEEDSRLRAARIARRLAGRAATQGAPRLP